MLYRSGHISACGSHTIVAAPAATLEGVSGADWDLTDHTVTSDADPMA